MTLAAWMPAGPAAAAIVNYSIANPAADGWTGGALTIGSLSDSISILPSLITGTVNGVTSSFVPNRVGNGESELWYYNNVSGNHLDLYSTDFGSLTETAATTWQNIITTRGGTYANNYLYFAFSGASPSVGSVYSYDSGKGTSVTFSVEVPVPAPLALLLAAVPAVWLTRRRQRSVRAG
ncbi:PEP-CTERM sorting domain-containing protein [Candidatus Thiodictyon syntrophicum]|uniref:PEP-CTERM sorting domain-containing protein n=1 Tax=Candidatus Thiodictyon syntrophicum TaxID=1166950 RepID=UPI0012FE4F2D|nr:PEP-CTERM sorting domain-containing protein [Candidatus Thiodictyon syntrophicum]